MRILLLTHRIPYPPDKGDKIRSFHLLEALRSRHDVRLITHADDARDLQHVPELRKRCRAVSVHPPGSRLLRTAAALVSGKPLSFARFHDRRAEREVREALEHDRPDAVVVCSAQPAAYLPEGLRVPVHVDLVDVDSEKWAGYATRARGIMRRIFSREARLVRSFERSLAARGFRISLATPREAEVFRRSVADVRVDVVPNGVDIGPGAAGAARVPGLMVFVGAMDYVANREAAVLAAREVLPLVRERIPGARLRIVGRNPADDVRALGALPGVEVTGEVADVGAELDRAELSLLPLLTVRGVPNKLLEAFARGLPVVTTPAALEAVGARHAGHALAAEGARGLADAAASLLLDRALAGRIGAAGRDFARERFRWERFDAAFLDIVEGGARETARV